jgi:two-component sensor histidine kinase
VPDARLQAKGRRLYFLQVVVNEQQRLDAVHRYQILDTPPDGAFDRITAIASRLLAAPIAIVSIVDEDRIWFKSHHGLDIEQVPRGPGLCASCVMQDGPWIVSDARRDARAFTNSLVAGFGLQFYLGIPLATGDGFNLGTLCVLDFVPREPTDVEISLVRDLASLVMDELELRLASKRAHADYRDELTRREQREERITALNRELAHRSKNLLALVQAIVRQTTARSASIADYAQRLCKRVQGLARTHDLIIADDWEGVTLGDLIGRQLEPFLDNPQRLRLEGPAVALTPAAAQHLGLAFHELAANSLKHGVLAQPSGYIDLRWRIEQVSGGRLLHIDYREEGFFLVARGSEGFGRLVLERLTPQALEGNAKWNFEQTGVTWHLDCPLRSVTATG